MNNYFILSSKVGDKWAKVAPNMNLRKSTQHLEKEIISDNKPLQGENLLLPHLNVQVQDDSK
jgi:hypothetical protein